MTTTFGAASAVHRVFSDNEVRPDGHDKVSGRMKYTADFHKPNELWAAFTLSPFAHARIVSVDLSAARAVDGVRTVLLAEEIGHPRMGRMLYDWPVLASGIVRFPGERVAAVAAETREAAEHASSLVRVEYEELPAILDAAEALRSDAPILHPDGHSYFYGSALGGTQRPAVSHPNVQGEKLIRKGATDLEGIFAGAHRVFEHKFTTPRVHAGHIEPRATVVWIEADGTVRVISANKAPFFLREQLANTIGIPRESIIVEPSAIGGDFGGKGLTIDEFACYYLARATGRPVRHVESYTDALRAGPYRHPAQITLKTAVDENGTFIAHESTVLFAGGAYAGGKPTPSLLPGSGYYYVPYQIPNARIEISCVYTNTAPPAHIRTPVSVQLYFGWEQHVDLMAEALGRDPLDFRVQNCVRQGETFPSNESIRDVTGEKVLETLRRETAWGKPLPSGRGRGIAFGCSRNSPASTSLRMRLTRDGRVDILTGVPDQGVGVHTMMLRVAAAALNLDVASVTVRRGATDVAGMDWGVGAGWGTRVNGGAVEDAARVLREQICEKTGYAWRGDEFIDSSGRSVSTVDLAALACADGPIDAIGRYEGSFEALVPADFTFTALCVEVEVDRDTGAFAIVDSVMVLDVGTIINPIGHQGQIDGGYIYGLGDALMEEVLMDESGKVTTLSLGDYKLPTMADVPPFRTVLVPAEPGEGPFGAKAAGEVSNIGVPAAVMNAVANAVGVRLSHFPITSDRLFEALARQSAEIPNVS